jgi:leucyl aminopeptidase
MQSIKVVEQSKASIICIPLCEVGEVSAFPTTLSETTMITDSQLQRVFKGKAGEIFQTFGAQGQRYFFIGCGSTLSSPKLIEQFRLLFFQNQTIFEGKIAIDMRHLPVTALNEDLVGDVTEGITMGLHITTKPLNNAEKVSSKVTGIELVMDQKVTAVLKKRIERGQTLAQIRSAIIDLVNLPSNFKTPTMLGDFVVEQGKKYGFEAEFLLEKELKKQGFHALLAIGQGSVEDSAFIIMKYRGTKSKATDIGLVGKGITFDTGGISIKPSDNMHFMKSDMGGAAMMIGTMMAVAALDLPINITAVVPSAENMPSGNAVKPSDVFSSYSGKTIEMIDTDAEGRVVLADGLAWMVKNEKPEIMLDAATLTGSIVRSLGSKAAGLFSNNTDLVSRLISSGEHTGERLWPMPLWDDYLDEIASDVADVRNFSGVPTAGAISAAKFLEVFTDKHPAWAHMDIAGVAFGTNPYTKMRSATGFGIKLLVDFIEKSVK